MIYTCPVCSIPVLRMPHCFHEAGKYKLFIHYNGVVNVYIDRVSLDTHLFTLRSPKRLDENYIDMMLLLK